MLEKLEKLEKPVQGPSEPAGKVELALPAGLPWGLEVSHLCFPGCSWSFPPTFLCFDGYFFLFLYMFMEFFPFPVYVHGVFSLFCEC